MNKKLKITLYILVGLVIFYHVLKFSGILVAYSIPTSSNEPNIKHGSYTLASNLITPKRGDFITYNFNDALLGKATWMHRLCGIENDTIQIIKGTLFVNGKNFDEAYSLKHSYILTEQETKSLPYTNTELFLINKKEGRNTYIAHIEDKLARRCKLKKARLVTPINRIHPEIQNAYQQKWNKDHFGPLIIPEGKVFVLGDNRDNSMDSRFNGLIDRNDVTGVLWTTF